jgi:hypothetical protein
MFLLFIQMDNSRLGEIEVRKIPEDRLRVIQRQAFDASHDFFLSIIFDDVLQGSGTLVDAWGTLGILTAHHVAVKLDNDPFLQLCSPLTDSPHRFEIPRECIEHIPLGVPNPGTKADGPDLSFLKLSGVETISTLKSKKSFYRISDKPFDVFRTMGLEKLFWWILGAPAQISRPMTSTSDEGALMAKHLIAEAHYKSLTHRGNLDILRLILNAGEAPFPNDYRGASGGSVWVSALTLEQPGADLSTIELTPCFLAGVLFYQSDLDPVSQSREILANGPRTIEWLLERFKPGGVER